MRTRTARGGLVVGVQEPAGVDGQAAAADAGREPVAQRLERRDLPVEVVAPAAREPLPVAAGRGSVGGERCERAADPLEWYAGGSPGLDDRDAAKDGSVVAALVPARSVGGDQPLRLVEAEGRGGDAAAARDFADRQLVGHRLDLNHTLSSRLRWEWLWRLPNVSSTPRRSPTCAPRAGSSSTSTGTRCVCSRRATACTRSTTAAPTWASRCTAARSPTEYSPATGTTPASTSARAARSTSSRTTCGRSRSSFATARSGSTSRRARM